MTTFVAVVGAPDGTSVRAIELSSTSFPGFSVADISLSMDQLANGFSIDYAPDATAIAKRPAFVGDTVQIRVDGEALIDGYIDETQEDYEPGRLNLAIMGRSKAADLVDSSCLLGKPARWRRSTARTIVQDICTPFGISVIVVGDVGSPIQRFAAERGEIAGDAIRRAAALRGLQAYSVGADLVLARAGSLRSSTTVEEGFNVRSASRSHSHMQRHSLYRFRGQTKATDEITGLKAGQLGHEVTDPAVGRYRPLDLRAEGHSNEDMGKRAVLERNRRAGAGERLTVRVDSATMETGQAWRPNMLVPVKLPALAVDATLLISTVRFRVSARSIDTTLELTRPESYDQADYPSLARGEAWR